MAALMLFKTAFVWPQLWVSISLYCKSSSITRVFGKSWYFLNSDPTVGELFFLQTGKNNISFPKLQIIYSNHKFNEQFNLRFPVKVLFISKFQGQMK